MDKIIQERHSGKTEKLILRSSKTGEYIICHSKKEAIRIQSKARELGLTVPLPLSYDEFTRKQYLGKGIKGFLFDNVDSYIQSLTNVPVTIITLTGTYKTT